MNIKNHPRFEEALELIADYLEREFGDHVRVSELENMVRSGKPIGIAYTETEDEEHEIQVYVNLANYSIDTYLDGQFADSVDYNSLDDLIDNELAWLDFDSLVSLDPDLEHEWFGTEY